MAKTNTWEYNHVKLSQGNREEKVESCQDGLKKLENKDELKEDNCNSALIAELVNEVKRLKIETISLRDEIKKIKADRDRELERQSEEIKDCVQNLQQEKEKCNKALNQLRCELTKVRSSITTIQRQEETQRKLEYIIQQEILKVEKERTLTDYQIKSVNFKKDMFITDIETNISLLKSQSENLSGMHRQLKDKFSTMEREKSSRKIMTGVER